MLKMVLIHRRTAMTIVKHTTPEQQKILLEILAKRLIHREFQIDNQKSISKAELKEAIKDYELDRDSMIQLILIKAKEMGYPEMKDWSDTKPMSALNSQSGGKLAPTQAYQNLLGQILFL
jgi:hypothetical protein